MKARFLWATVIALMLLSLPALVLAQPPIEPSAEIPGDGVGAAPLGSPDALWDQPSGALMIVIDQYFPDVGAGVYQADDFINSYLWYIESIFVDGRKWHDATGSLPQADSLNWFIYPDAGGVPAGYPGCGGELWSHSCLPTAPEVTLSGPNNDQATLDIVKAQGTPLYLPPGHYWLCFYPSLNFTLYGQWGWLLAGTTNFATAHVIDPFDILYQGWTSWTPSTVIDPIVHDLAFRLEGTEIAPEPNAKYLHSHGLFNLTDPLDTQWHELWPIFCREYHLSSWEDNGDGILSYCDTIDMYEKPDGEVKWYHVEEVTITLNVTLVDVGDRMFIELEGGYNETALVSPPGTQWHEIYPVFCTTYLLVGWMDNDSRTLDWCDGILLMDKETGEESWWHVEEVSVDIIVTPEPPPVGGEAYPVSKASLLAPWIALGLGVAGVISWYVLKRRKAQS